VFPTVEGVRRITTIPGNHDIGLGDGIQVPRLNRFKEYFTEENSTSQRFETCNFEILLLDTPSMLNTHDPDVSEPPSLFLDDIPERKESVSRILFTHIPLFRPENTDCGPFRESGRPIHSGAGYQYQNTLSRDITTRILDAVWPLNAIFSGDDHDYCMVEHTMEGRRETVPEYTVKSFSWAMVSRSA
jgi:ethanolamine phosphate phosphodiesterase